MIHGVEGVQLGIMLTAKAPSLKDGTRTKKAYFIAIQDHNKKIHLTAGSGKARSMGRRKIRLSHDSLHPDLDSALRGAVSLLNRKIYRSKNPYEIVEEYYPDPLIALQYSQLRGRLPCQVPFHVDQLDPTTVDCLERFTELEIE